jgi:hypothetical protein
VKILRIAAYGLVVLVIAWWIGRTNQHARACIAAGFTGYNLDRHACFTTYYGPRLNEHR